MVYKCAAIDCQSGYSSEEKKLNVTYHSFPLKNEELLCNWLKNIARKNFKPSKYSKLCSLHFKADDFIKVSHDSNQRRKRKRDSEHLCYRRLKPGAVPSIFKNIPLYYTNKDIPLRSGNALSKTRHDNESAILQKQCENFLQSDNLKNFNDLLEKLSCTVLSPQFVLYKSEAGISLIYLSIEQPFSILFSINIDKDLHVQIYHEKKLIPPSCYHHILSSEKVTLFSEVENLIAFAKNLDQNITTLMETIKAKLLNLIEKYIDLCQDDYKKKPLNFILEQLKLLFITKKQRRYSVEILVMSYIMHATSSKAYERLCQEQIIILPSVITLRKITMNLDQRTGLDDSDYLNIRFSKLNFFDRNVLLMIDEIYLSKRVESSGGQVFGLTESCAVAATALCFMIKSLSSDYQDMVGIYPIKNLKAETQKACFDKVMLLVHEIGFNVIGICVDNASANRKFFKDFFCNGAWKASIPNKYTDGKIFLIFDPTHIIKNIYNNLVNRRVFEMPCMTPILDTPLTASFADIEKVYNLECQKPLRIAHRLTETVLKPNSIEKVNVKLALAVFHESTVIGLKEYGFHETASAIDLFLKLWNILNVSTSEIGKHKRDISRDPVRSTADWKLKFLTDFGHYVSFWKNSNVSMFCKLFLFKNIKHISYLYLIC